MTIGQESLRYKYTWGIIRCRQTNQILLLNRQKAPWMGRWNGFGGKLDEGENPLDCITREAKEETGLSVPNFVAHGAMEWDVDGEEHGGMHLFVGEFSKEEVEAYHTPVMYCKEGILDWKKLDWVMHEENTGVVDNVKIMLENLFEAPADALFRVKYSNGKLINMVYYPHRDLISRK